MALSYEGDGPRLRSTARDCPLPLGGEGSRVRGFLSTSPWERDRGRWVSQGTASSPLHIRLVTRIDADHIARLDEQRHLDRRARLELRGLGGPRHRVAFESGVRAHD